MAEVRIHDDEPFARGGARARDHRAGKTEGRRVALDQLHRHRTGEGTNAFARAIRRAVVDENNLVGRRRALRDAGQERRDVVHLVESGNDERDHDRVRCGADLFADDALRFLADAEINSPDVFAQDAEQ